MDMAARHLTVMLRVFYPIYSSVRKGGRLLFSQQYLLYTNIGLSVGISAFGDVLQQKYQHRKRGSVSKVSWDYFRTSKMAASGLLIGPLIHYWYQHLDAWFPGRCLRTLSKKVFMDLVICSPLCVFLFLVVTGLLDGQGWGLIKDELKDTGKTMCITDVIVWTPAQTFNFYFLPTRFRMLFDNSVSLAIDTYFSHLRFGENSSYRQQIKPAADDKELSENKLTIETKIVQDTNVI